MQLANYLFFTTQCEAALSFYEACELGRATILLRYGVDGAPMPSPCAARRICS